MTARPAPDAGREASWPRHRMRREREIAIVRRVVGGWKRLGHRVAFVPTMGAIHEGHLGLVRRARASAERVVASIFVNPLQFGPQEDYKRYPRPRARDHALLAGAGVDLLWEPRAQDLYPPGECTRVRVTGLGDVLEGGSRPGHFEGVATVVLKLLHVVEPHLLWMGQKDAQQARLVEQMCRDLHLPVTVRRGATVREPGGLACSSRNLYLDLAQRAQAVGLSRGLASALRALRDGERSAARIIGVVRQVWREYPDLVPDYVSVVDAHTFQPVRRVQSRVLVAVAARVGKTRLIDNFEWGPP